MEIDRSDICNVMPSPYDERDWEYEARVVSAVGDITLPKTFKCDKLRPVKNQGSRGTCVAMSLSCMKEYQEAVDDPRMINELMSPNSVYIYRQPTSGMYPRNAMKILQEKGMCTERLFPYDRKEEPTKIPKEAVEEAKHYKIKSYARVTTIKGAKEALVEYGPLCVAFPYYSNGTPYFWKKPSVDAKLGGGHAVAIIGWNEKGFILRNSWGEKWNGDGHVIYPYEDWGAHWEIWSAIDEDTDYIPDHLKNANEGCFKTLLKLCRR